MTVEIAFLRAVTYGRHDLRLVTRAGLLFDAVLPLDRAALYFDVILDVLPVSKLRALESFMEKERLKFRSEFMRNLVKEGLAKGEAKGRAEGLRGALRAILEARDIKLSATQRRQLDKCDDVSVLSDWVKRAARAKTGNDVFSSASSAPRSQHAPRAPRSTNATETSRSRSTRTHRAR